MIMKTLYKNKNNLFKQCTKKFSMIMLNILIKNTKDLLKITNYHIITICDTTNETGEYALSKNVFTYFLFHSRILSNIDIHLFCETMRLNFPQMYEKPGMNISRKGYQVHKRIIKHENELFYIQYRSCQLQHKNNEVYITGVPYSAAILFDAATFRDAILVFTRPSANECRFIQILFMTEFEENFPILGKYIVNALKNALDLWHKNMLLVFFTKLYTKITNY